MGVEPTTFRLQSGCSATKLYWLTANSKSDLLDEHSPWNPLHPPKRQKFSFNKIRPTKDNCYYYKSEVILLEY